MKKLIFLAVFALILICLSTTNSFAQQPHKKGTITSKKVTLKRTEKKGNKKIYNKPKKSILKRPFVTNSSSVRQTRQNKTQNRKKAMTELSK